MIPKKKMLVSLPNTEWKARMQLTIPWAIDENSLIHVEEHNSTFVFVVLFFDTEQFIFLFY